jgi:uncharacterized membrane protein
MDENKPPEESTPTPTSAPAPEPVAAPAPVPTAQPGPGSSASNFASAATAGTPKGGPVPFSGPPDPSVPQEQKTHALLSWLLMFVISFISPLIFFFMAADKPFLKHHAATALTLVIVNIGISIALFILAFILALAGPLALLMLPIWGIYALAMLALIIMGAIAGNAGSRFEPPLIGNLAKSWFKA